MCVYATHISTHTFYSLMFRFADGILIAVEFLSSFDITSHTFCRCLHTDFVRIKNTEPLLVIPTYTVIINAPTSVCQL